MSEFDSVIDNQSSIALGTEVPPRGGLGGDIATGQSQSCALQNISLISEESGSPRLSYSKLAKMDGLFHHLCDSSGLFSKETFLSLFGSISRMIRDHRLRGFVISKTLGDEDFETLAYAIAHLPDVPFYAIGLDPNELIYGQNGGQNGEIQKNTYPELALIKPTYCLSSEESGLSANTGFLVVLTDRLCAAMFWSSEPNETYRLYQGGWTFHPEDTRTIALHLIGHLSISQNVQPLLQLLNDTVLDRRYDKKLSVLISSLVNSLESRNRELSKALIQVNELNRKIVESERLAAIGQLCSVIAHEIRNPLGLIDLYARLVENQLSKIENLEGQEVLQNNLSLIRQATGNLETILSELTNYSRPLTLNPEPVDLAALLQEIVNFYRPSFDEKGVQLEIASSQTIQQLQMNLDSGKIRQALINLIKNALEASPSGTCVTLSVAGRQEDQNIYIKVKDQGVGIDSKVIKKLFTPYFSTKGQGTGLGLAHSRKILQAHGGSVELLSTTLNQGCTFALILPKSLMCSPES